MKKGIVLEGGAMRGMFTAGVIDVLLENNIEFDGCVGVSAGAVFGCNYKSRQKGRVIRYNKKYAKDPRYCSFRSLIKTGDLYGVEFCYDTLPLKLDLFDLKAYAENPMKFYSVSTDASNGRAVYSLIESGVGKDLKWLQASASMPIVSKPVEIDGSFYLDGGISDSIPLEFMQKQGYEKNLVVLTQPAGYIKEPPSIMPLFRLSLKKYPKIIEAMQNRHLMYNKETEYVIAQEKLGNALVIRPPKKLDIGKIEHNPEKMQQAYEAGVNEAIKNLDKIKEYFSEGGK